MDAPPRTPFRTPHRTPSAAHATPGTPLEQTSATPIVDLSTIERNKENILTLKKGRSASALARSFSMQQRERSLKLDGERVIWEQKLASQQDSDDPLDVWHNYVSWVIENYPAGQSVESGLVTLLERATRHFKDEKRYHQDPRYLRLWVNYAHNVDAPRDVFNFCLANEIGTSIATLYEELASIHYQHGLIHEADAAYRLGIARKATPLDRIEKNYLRFQERVLASELSGSRISGTARTYQDILHESAEAARTHPPSGSIGVLRVRSGGHGGLSVRSNAPTNNGARAPVFEDREEVGGAARVRDLWADVGTRSSRKQENALEPGKMAGTRIEINANMVRRRGGGGALSAKDVFHDEDEDEEGESTKPNTTPEDQLKAKEGDELKRNPFKHWSTGTKLTPSAEDLALPESSKAKDRSSRHREHREHRSRSDKHGSSSRHHREGSSSRPRTDRSRSSKHGSGDKDKEQYAVPMDKLYPGLAARLMGEKPKVSDYQKPSYDTGERSMDEVLVAKHYPSSALSDTLDPWAHLDALVGRWMPEDEDKPKLRGGFLMAVDEEDEDMDVDGEGDLAQQRFSRPDRTPLASKRSLAPKLSILGERPVLGEKTPAKSPLGAKPLEAKMPLGEKPLAAKALLGEKPAPAKTSLGEKPLAAKTPLAPKPLPASDEPRPRATPVLGEKSVPSKNPVLGEKAVQGEKAPVPVPHAPGPSAPKSVLGEKRAAHTPKANNITKKPAPDHAVTDAADALPSMPSPNSRKALFAAPDAAPPEPMADVEYEESRTKRPPSPTVMTKAAMEEINNMFNGDEGEDDSDEDSDSDSDSDVQDEEEDEESESAPAPASLAHQLPASRPAPSKLQIYEDETDIFAPPRKPNPPTTAAPFVPSAPASTSASEPAPASTPVAAPALAPIQPPEPKPATVPGTPVRQPMSQRGLAQRGAPKLAGPSVSSLPVASEKEEDEEDDDDDEEEEEYGAPASLLQGDGQEGGEAEDYPRLLSPITEVTEFTRYSTWAPSPAAARHPRASRLSLAPRMSDTLDHGRTAPQTSSSRVLPPRTPGSKFPPTTPRAMAPLPSQTEEPHDTTDDAQEPEAEAIPESVPVPISQPVLSIPNPCTPDDAEIHNALLAQLPTPLESLQGYIDATSQSASVPMDAMKKAAKTIAKKPTTTDKDNTATTVQAPAVELGGHLYGVKDKLGEGGFASVYLAEDLDGALTKTTKNLDRSMSDLSLNRDDSDEDEDDEEQDDLIAVKVESPANKWEFHCLRKVETLLAGSRAASSIVRARQFATYADASILWLDFKPQGNLLRLVNRAQDANAAPQGEGGLHEPLAMFFTIELVRTIEALHQVGIIHGDVKIDNCMLRVTTPKNQVYSPEGNDGWADTGLSLLDFGRSIDTSLYPADQVFKAGWEPDARDIPVIRAGRPWKYEADYMGIATVAHTLLFGKYLDTTADEMGQIKVTSPMRRYWNKDLWTDFFNLMLNPAQPDQPCMQPLLSELAEIRQRMEQHLVANGNTWRYNIRGMLKKIEIWSMG